MVPAEVIPGRQAGHLTPLLAGSTTAWRPERDWLLVPMAGTTVARLLLDIKRRGTLGVPHLPVRRDFPALLAERKIGDGRRKAVKRH